MMNNQVVNGYLNCKYKAYLLINGQLGVKRKYNIFYEELLNKNKSKFYEHAKENIHKDNLEEDVELDSTIKNNRITLVLRPSLSIRNFEIVFDAIKVESNRSYLAKKNLIPILITPNSKITKFEKNLLSIYSFILSKITGVKSTYGKIYCGPDLNPVNLNVMLLQPKAKKMFEELQRIAEKSYVPRLYQNSHCKVCEFKEMCRAKLIEKDDLSLLSGINERKLVQYEKKGIFTIKQLSYTFNPRKRGKRVRAKDNPYYASLQALALRENKIFLYSIIDMPIVKTKIFIDIEGNSESNFIYLIGLIIEEDDTEKRISLWADTQEDENKIIDEFIKILGEIKEPHLFYYGKYEWRLFNKISSKPDVSNEILALIYYHSTNILDVIYTNIYFPTYSNSLKEIGKYLGCTWSHSNLYGLESVVWRKKWEMEKEIHLKNELVQYNIEDCNALKLITNFLYQAFSKKSIESGNKLENVSLIEDIKDNGEAPWLDIKFASEDIKIVTKCAYFEYQRNKIFFRTNDKIKKIKHRKTTLTKQKFKPNNVIYCHTNKCERCGSKKINYDNRVMYSKRSLDLTISRYGVRKKIIIYHCYRYKCYSCNRILLPSQYTQPLRFGHNLLVWSMHQYIAYQISMESLSKISQQYFGLPLDNRQIWRLKVSAANYYQDSYNKIFEKIIKGNLIHADETKVNFQHGSGYIWVFSNMEDVYYLYRPTREANFLHNSLKEFNGILITDFYSGYDSLECLQQKCLIHLIRDLNNALLKNSLDNELKELVLCFGGLVRTIIGTIDKFGLKTRHLRKHKRDIIKFFKYLRKKDYNSDVSEKFKKRLIKYESKLFLFLDYDNIPWNNNNAEHAIKHFAKYRSLVNGRLSADGIQDYLTLLSIYQTCNYKGINFLDFLLSKEKDIDRFIEQKNNPINLYKPPYTAKYSKGGGD